jgi:hypothetical protein
LQEERVGIGIKKDNQSRYGSDYKMLRAASEDASELTAEAIELSGGWRMDTLKTRISKGLSEYVSGRKDRYRVDSSFAEFSLDDFARFVSQVRSKSTEPLRPPIITG